MIDRHIKNLEAEVRKNDREKIDRIDKLLLEMDALALKTEEIRMRIYELKEAKK